MQIHVDHFELSIIFALLVSIVLGLVSKRTNRERANYAAYCFGCFMVALFGIGWFMRLLHG